MRNLFMQFASSRAEVKVAHSRRFPRRGHRETQNAIMKISANLAILYLLGEVQCFSPLNSSWKVRSKVFSIEPQTKTEQTEESYLEIEYEGFFDRTKVRALLTAVTSCHSSCCFANLLHEARFLVELSRRKLCSPRKNNH